MPRLLLTLLVICLQCPGLAGQEVESDRLAEIAKLEKQMRAGEPIQFDYYLHNSLRHLYGGIDEGKSMRHVDVIFQNRPFDDYTLMAIGAKNTDEDAARRRVLELAQRYPQYKYLAATCWTIAGKLSDDPTKREANFKNALAVQVTSQAFKEAVEDYHHFQLNRHRVWPTKITPPANLAKRVGPWSDPKDTSIWPNQTSRANSDPWLAEHHDKIRLMRPRLLIINFSNEHSRDHLRTLTYQLSQALAESSRYHGYKNPKAPVFLDYQVFKVIDLRDQDRELGDSRLIPTKTPSKNTPFNFKYRSLFSDEFARYYGIPDPENSNRNLRLNELLDGGYIHEVWCFFAGSGKVESLVSGYEVVEEKPRYDDQFRKIGDEWVQAGNGGDAEQPWVGRSCRINFINCSRGIGCAMENLGHGLEGFAKANAIPYFSEYFLDFSDFNWNDRYQLPVNSGYEIQTNRGSQYDSSELLRFPTPNSLSVFHNGAEYKVENYIAHGGNVHFPPNGRRHYDLANAEPVLSTIEDWRIGSGPDGQDLAKPFSNRAFLQYSELAPDCMGSWLVYWRQNMPGLDNKQKDRLGKPMKNWWPFLFY